MSFSRHVLSIVASTLVLGAGHAVAASSDENLFEEYCTKCHNFEDFSGGITLEGVTVDSIHMDREVGEKVIRRLRAGMMPPAGEPRPDVATMQAFAASLENDIDTHAEVNPGRPGLHRLNRTEYGNAVRDLLSLQIDPAEYFPADDSSRGFDNQAGTLVLSPALLEAYLSASAKISQLALGTATTPSQTLYRVAEDANQNFRIEGLPFGTRGGIKFSHNFPVDGEYTFKTFAITLGNMGSDRAFGDIRGEKLQVLVDGVQVKVFDWDQELGLANQEGGNVDGEEATGVNLPTLDVTLPLTAGAHEIGITFLATNFAPGLDMNNDFERSTIETGGLPGYTWFPHVGSVRVDGPYNVTGTGNSESRQAVMVCSPANTDEEPACADQIITRLAEVAYRGKQTPEDIDTLKSFYEQGRQTGNFDSGIEMALQRVLASPKFIYRIEDEPANLAANEIYQISDVDLASRLSFFLWSSIPDQELLDLAKAGKLSDDKVLEQQVSRMLEDPRSKAMTANFAGQWLALRNLESQVPVVDQFPDFDDLLRESFRVETEMLFDSLIRENRPVTELLTADYTFVNERLAMHYGIPGVKGERFRRVQLDGDLAIRRGILGKGSMLTVAAQPGRTSPVMRGQWTLANIIGVEPPPPPPNVPALEAKETDAAGNGVVPSMRERMEEHRANPACQGCHRLMDPIGFALETFDAVGKYRTTDNGSPIDTTGQLYDGTPIHTAADLGPFLLSYKDSFLRNATQRMLTYALGRGVEYEDMPLVRKVKAEADKDDFRFHALVTAVVKSEAFLNNAKTEVSATTETSVGMVSDTAATTGGL
ncbi:MAG: DUF1592 domain-containing protein [Pseudomonadota bacterium]